MIQIDLSRVESSIIRDEQQAKMEWEEASLNMSLAINKLNRYNLEAVKLAITKFVNQYSSINFNGYVTIDFSHPVKTTYGDAYSYYCVIEKAELSSIPVDKEYFRKILNSLILEYIFVGLYDKDVTGLPIKDYSLDFDI